MTEACSLISSITRCHRWLFSLGAALIFCSLFIFFFFFFFFASLCSFFACFCCYYYCLLLILMLFLCCGVFCLFSPGVSEIFVKGDAHIKERQTFKFGGKLGYIQNCPRRSHKPYSEL